MQSIYACTFLAKIAKVVKDTKVDKKELRTELPLQASACSSYQPDLLLMTDETAKQVSCFDKLDIVMREEIILIVFNVDEQVNREAKIKVVSMSPALLL